MKIAIVAHLILCASLSAQAYELDLCHKSLPKKFSDGYLPSEYKGGGIFGLSSSNGGSSQVDFADLPRKFSWQESIGTTMTKVIYEVDLASGQITSKNNSNFSSHDFGCKKVGDDNDCQEGLAKAIAHLTSMKNKLSNSDYVLAGGFSGKGDSDFKARMKGYVPILECMIKMVEQSKTNENYKSSLQAPRSNLIRSSSKARR